MGREVKKIIMGNKENTMNEKVGLIKALLDFQSKITTVNEDSTNPYFNSKYTDYETLVKATRKTLIECGLVVVHLVGQSKVVQVTNETKTKELYAGLVQTNIRTILAHTSGESIESNITVTHDLKPHTQGSAISYGKRYSYIGILALSTGNSDDDANQANDSVAKALKESTSRVVGLPDDIKKALKEIGITDVLKADIFCNQLKYDLASIRTKLSLNKSLDEKA